MRRLLPALLILLPLILGACGTPAPGIEYHCTSDIAEGSDRIARDDHLKIDAQGNATLVQLSQKNSFTLSEQELQALQALFDKAQFGTLQAEYLHDKNNCALADYVIIYKGHKVHTQEGAVPEKIRPIIEALDRIIWQHGRW